MDQGYFTNDDYFKYLLEHCTDESAAAQGRVGGREMILDHLNRFSVPKGADLLEIGCGTGRVMEVLRSHYGVDVTGGDICEKAIGYIREQRPHFAGKAFVLPTGDWSCFADSSFGHLLFWGSFELLEPRTALAEAARVLRVGGRAMLSSVKNIAFREDDASAAAAAKAYREKRIPLYMTDVAAFEALLDFMGFVIEERAVFQFKDDAPQNRYVIDQGGDGRFAEAIYTIRKVRDVPAGKTVGRYLYSK
ncbi:MAG TPA: class I SAM-dependent methyltransferase [Magnetospirillum sp.]|nr:class I SAM-dependent methyltransferase [Magnetospirillum sp.]